MFKSVRVAAYGHLMFNIVKGTVNINYWWTPYA